MAVLLTWRLRGGIDRVSFTRGIEVAFTIKKYVWDLFIIDRKEIVGPTCPISLSPPSSPLPLSPAAGGDGNDRRTRGRGSARHWNGNGGGNFPLDLGPPLPRRPRLELNTSLAAPTLVRINSSHPQQQYGNLNYFRSIILVLLF